MPTDRYRALLLLLTLLAGGCSILQEPEQGEVIFSLSFDRDTFLDTTLLLISLVNRQEGRIETQILLTQIEPGRLPQSFPPGRNRILKIEAFGPVVFHDEIFLSRWGVGSTPPIDLVAGRRTFLPDPICVYRTVHLADLTHVTTDTLDIRGVLEPGLPLFLETTDLLGITFSGEGAEDPSCAPFTNYLFTVRISEGITRFRLFPRNEFGAPLPATLFFVARLPRKDEDPTINMGRILLPFSAPIDDLEPKGKSGRLLDLPDASPSGEGSGRSSSLATHVLQNAPLPAIMR
ncbi:MAG: hypothetical protein D6812_14790 [Deltaproteobacteria bacterium]|nr:MAG: hypothetical protein D6812_14790 [Deltaproteobacteria bacterium]